MSKRSKAERNTSKLWWNAGHALGGRNSTKPENQGLDDRAQKGHEVENTKPYGRSMTKSAIKDRAGRKDNRWPWNY